MFGESYQLLETKEKTQISLLVHLLDCKYRKKTIGLWYSKYLFLWHGRLQIHAY